MSALQDGIYYQAGRSPGRCWRLMLLDVMPGTTPAAAKAAVAALWGMLGDLRRGLVRDLNPVARRADDPVGPVAVPADGLTCLLAYGARLFDPMAHPLPVAPNARRPPRVTRFRLGAAGPFRAIRWVPEPLRRQTDGDLALQFVADSELAVNRAAVESVKAIADGTLPLRVAAMYDGFGRSDGRSWIDFHDGVNTMTPEQRERAMLIDDDLDVPWMVGGTYLAFLRLAVDLPLWRALTRDQQELIVGRQKITGCPFVSTAAGSGVTAACGNDGTLPAAPTPAFLDPPRPSADPVLRASHIHRANLNRGADPREAASNRVYRQGYEFLESMPGDAPRVGLNFVSFQKDLERVTFVLRADDWFGSANFGGPDVPAAGEPPNPALLGLLAGGFYAVPPAGDPFPGAGVFD